MNRYVVTSRAYSRALTRLRDIHREEFDELYQAARLEVADELDVEEREYAATTGVPGASRAAGGLEQPDDR